jgi:hypothetical protein
VLSSRNFCLHREELFLQTSLAECAWNLFRLAYAAFEFSVASSKLELLTLILGAAVLKKTKESFFFFFAFCSIVYFFA